MLHRLIPSSFVGVVLLLAACSKETSVTQTAPICGRGEYSCDGDTLQRCRDDGTGFDGIQICEPGGCVQGKSDCQTPPEKVITPLGSSDWVACPRASYDREAGELPCKPVDVQADVGGKSVRVRIDPYEVSRAEYLRFWKVLEPGAALPGLPPYCAFKDAIGHTPELPGWPSLNETEARTPVQGVDWCDAWAYCRWAGKRMCGAPGGGPATYAFTANDTTSAEGKRTDNEWSIACNGGGVRQWPYGDTQDETACNTRQKEDQTARPAGPIGAYPGCVTPEGVFDLSGNVHELIAMCDGETGRDDMCIVAGGGTNVFGYYADCGLNQARRGTRNILGFRCCGD